MAATKQQLQQIRTILDKPSSKEVIYRECGGILDISDASTMNLVQLEKDILRAIAPDKVVGAETSGELKTLSTEVFRLFLAKRMTPEEKASMSSEAEASASHGTTRAVRRGSSSHVSQARNTNRAPARAFSYSPTLIEYLKTTGGVDLLVYIEGSNKQNFQFFPFNSLPDDLDPTIGKVTRITKEEFEQQQESFTIYSDNNKIKEVLENAGVYDELLSSRDNLGNDPVDIAINVLRLQKSCTNDNALKVPDSEFGLLQNVLPEIAKSVVFTQRTRRLFDIYGDKNLVPNPNYRSMVIVTGAIPCLKKVSEYTPHTDIGRKYCDEHIDGEIQHYTLSEEGIEKLQKDYEYALMLQAEAALQQNQGGISLVLPHDYISGLRDDTEKEKAKNCYANAIAIVKTKYPELKIYVAGKDRLSLAVQEILTGSGIILHNHDLIHPNQNLYTGKVMLTTMGNGTGKFGGGFLSSSGGRAVEEGLYTVCPTISCGVYSNQVFIGGASKVINTSEGVQGRRTQRQNFNPYQPCKKNIADSIAHKMGASPALALEDARLSLGDRTDGSIPPEASPHHPSPIDINGLSTRFNELLFGGCTIEGWRGKANLINQGSTIKITVTPEEGSFVSLIRGTGYDELCRILSVEKTSDKSKIEKQVNQDEIENLLTDIKKKQREGSWRCC